MPTPDEWLAGVRAKIKRANKHIRDLEGAIQTFRDSEPYGFRIEDDLKSGDKIYRLHIREETPKCFALFIGDAIHNLRSALDHLAWQLVKANREVPTPGPGGTAFPIYDTPPGSKSTKGKIKDICSRAQEIIDAAKPYKGGNDAFWILHQLDIVDKHMLLVVTAFALNEIMPTWKSSGIFVARRVRITSLTPKDGMVDANLVASGPHPQRFNLCVPIGIQADGALPVIQDGEIVAKLVAPINQEAKFDLSFEITIIEPAIAKTKPVVRFLDDLSDMVKDFAEQFVVAGCFP